MPMLRRLTRIFALIVWFVVTGLLTTPYLFNNWRCVRTCARIARWWGAGIAAIINLKIHVHGEPGAFTGGLLVSNHVSYLDIIVHAATFPLRFTPKIEIKRWPLLGWYLRTSHPIWVDRSSRQASAGMLKDFSETMREHIPLIVYPEGTSSDGKGLLPFKSTPFEAASRGNFTIFPLLLKYREDEQTPTLCWFGEMALIPHVWDILGRKEIQVDLYLLPPIAPQGKNRKELADSVRKIMADEYQKLMAPQR